MLVLLCDCVDSGENGTAGASNSSSAVVASCPRECGGCVSAEGGAGGRK